MNVSYRGIQCRGRPDDVVSEISHIVSQTGGLRRLIPRVCHEKSRGNRTVEFYLFVGHLDPDEDGDRAALDGFFAEIAHRSWHGAVLDEFPREQIRTMVGQDIRVEEFARRLRYKPLVLPDAGDPFAEEDDDIVRLDDLELTGRFDRLLWWMSAHGEGSFSTLDSARRALGIEMDTRRALRALRVLGHCETSGDGSRWSIAPSVLLQADDDRFVLAGARDFAMQQCLRERFRTEEWLQPRGAGPTVFVVHTAVAGDLDDLGIRFVPNADQALATVLPPIARWAESLDSVAFDPTSFMARRMNGGEFEDVATVGRDPGFYEFSGIGEHPRTFHLYYSPDLQWRRGEWYGLRFLARVRQFGAAPCSFDEAQKQLSVPLEWRWPEIFERSLVLSSGVLPKRDATGNWLVYTSIEPELLNLLRSPLQLEVEVING